MRLEELPERLGHRMDELRDRTASAVATDGDSILHELRRLASRLDGVEQRLVERLERLRQDDTARLDQLLSARRRTTWPRRGFWLLLGLAAGVAAAFLADPDRGRARRAKLSDQVAARARDLGSDAATQAKIRTDRARGTLIERAKDRLPEDVPDNPKVLEQRIRSEVFGARDDVTDVVLRVDGPGQVALKGTVPSATSERELLAAVGDVDGVVDVSSELAVRGG